MSGAEVPIAATTLPVLLEAVNDRNASAARIAEIVATDAGLATSVLRVANSVAFGLARTVRELDTAVALVGHNMVQTLALAGSTHLLDGAGGLPHMRDHAIQTACAARLLAGHIGLPEADAFAAGLLHDVGEILLWLQDPASYAAAHSGWNTIDSQLRGERGLFGADHATAARNQLAEWRLPGAIVDAVGDHHRPDLSHRDLSTVVAAAEDLIEAECTGRPSDRLHIGAEELQRIRGEVDHYAQEMRAVLVG